MKNTIITKIRKELHSNVDEKTVQTSQNFFKERINSYGVRIPTVNKISKDIFKELKEEPKQIIFELCTELWKSGNLEESIVACNWAYYIKEKFAIEDIKTFEIWLENHVNNWASCDTLCNHTIATYIEKYSSNISILKKWTKSNNRWVKRGAAVTLIIPARKGLFLKDIFEIADKLLLDEDDLVRKGYGWMLKAASEFYQQEVFDYVMSKKDIMPRTSLRYAIEKMSKELKTLAMQK